MTGSDGLWSRRRQLSPQIQAAVVHLSEAHDYARQTRSDLWEFAVEIAGRSMRWGFRATTCGGWSASGCAECGRETTKPGDTRGEFRPMHDLRFTRTTCFVVTDAGLRMTTTVPVELGVRRAA